MPRKTRKKKPATYKSAGVDIAAAERSNALIKKHVKRTFTKNVLRGMGHFGGVFDISEFKKYKNPVLISSVDGVGTKTKVASMMNKWDTIGQDLVNHCINDIMCVGAKPLFFLDYVASSKLKPKTMEQIVKGMAKACKESKVALVGGETAEMPGVYCKGEQDAVGCIVGVVEKRKILDGKNIRKGDVLIALPSNGLHTNGYSLARKIFVKNNKINKKVGKELLKVHRCYYKAVSKLMKKVEVRGLAHITGGGLPGNLPRILPKKYTCIIELEGRKIPKIFQKIQRRGRVSIEDMFNTFNMGVGLVIVVSKKDAKKALQTLKKEKPWILGEIESL